MPYHQLEELTSRKREKVALFLTAEHMAGVLVIAVPVYVCTLGTSFWLRAVLLVLAAVLGVLVTTDVNGMAFYERALWWLRGRLRRLVTGKLIDPMELAAPVVEHGRALPLGQGVRRKPMLRVKDRADDVLLRTTHESSGRQRDLPRRATGAAMTGNGDAHL